MKGVCVAIPVTRMHLRWLGECVSSVLAQTHPPDIVSIYVSDGSCPVFKSPVHTKISCFDTTKRVSAGVARNRAVDTCGEVEYVSLIDADDLMMPYALDRILALMRRHNATIALHNYFSPGETVVRNHENLRANKMVLATSTPPMQVRAHHGHVTVKKARWVAQSNLRRGQDSEFVQRMWTGNNTFLYTHEKLTRYMRRPTAVPRRARSSLREDIFSHHHARIRGKDI